MDDDALAKAWIGYHLWLREQSVRDARSVSAQDDHEPAGDDHGWWAYESLLEMVDDDPDRAWPLILRIIDMVPDERALANVAAGPIEQLLARHGRRFIDRVEAEAISNGRFRRSLVGVWGWYSIHDDVQERLRRLGFRLEG